MTSSLVFLVLSGTLTFVVTRDGGSNKTQPDTSSNLPAQDSASKQPTLDIRSAKSVHVLVNKKTAISPLDYKPADLAIPNVSTSESDSKEERSVREVIKANLETMLADAEKAGHKLTMNSGFRSAKSQAFYFNKYVRNYGLEKAKTFSAEPGHSEHQTGLAFDLSYSNRQCYLEECFGQTPAGVWLAENSYKYGFNLRYLKGKEEVTGYQYEPWHFRYLGRDIAKELFASKKTYEEYLAERGLVSL